MERWLCDQAVLKIDCLLSPDTTPDAFNIHCLLMSLYLMGSISLPLSIHLLVNYLVSLGWCVFQVEKTYNERDVNFLVEIKIKLLYI